jgi:hypothetical protein
MFTYKLGYANSVTSIEAVIETQQCVTFALLHYMSLSKVLLRRFYVTANDEIWSCIHAKCPILLSNFQQTLDFLDRFS